MQTDPSLSSGYARVGSVAALWRYPVKSMMGEELNASDITDRGLLRDRQFAVVDRATGRIGGAKNPRKWGNFFDFRAAYAAPPQAGVMLAPVRITLPDGTGVTTGQGDLDQVLSRALGREVTLEEARTGDRAQDATAEEYWPDLAGLDHRDTVTEFALPAGPFFDVAVVHLLTRRRSIVCGPSIRRGASRPGGSAPTSWSRPLGKTRALWRTTGLAAA
jgi:hypothetical protein